MSIGYALAALAPPLVAGWRGYTEARRDNEEGDLYRRYAGLPYRAGPLSKLESQLVLQNIQDQATTKRQAAQQEAYLQRQAQQQQAYAQRHASEVETRLRLTGANAVARQAEKNAADADKAFDKWIADAIKNGEAYRPEEMVKKDESLQLEWQQVRNDPKFAGQEDAIDRQYMSKIRAVRRQVVFHPPGGKDPTASERIEAATATNSMPTQWGDLKFPLHVKRGANGQDEVAGIRNAPDPWQRVTMAQKVAADSLKAGQVKDPGTGQTTFNTQLAQAAADFQNEQIRRALAEPPAAASQAATPLRSLASGIPGVPQVQAPGPQANPLRGGEAPAQAPAQAPAAVPAGVPAGAKVVRPPAHLKTEAEWGAWFKKQKSGDWIVFPKGPPKQVP